MALTVEDLYQQYAGRAPDAEGLAFWKAGFGSEITPEEVESFKQSVAAVKAAEPIVDFSNTAQNVPVNQNLALASSFDQNFAPSVVAPQNESIAINPSTQAITELYRNVLGREPDPEGLAHWSRLFGSEIDANELSDFLGAARQEVVNTQPQAGAVANLAKQILAQGTTNQWGGEGYGSAVKNAYDMAAMLAGQGLTDVSQFGLRTSDGQQEYYNKATGQAINPYYDKANAASNIWGGTFAGEGSTAYGAQFDANGNPLFYTQYGGSSSDLTNIAPLIQLALIAATAGGAGGMLGSSLGLTGTAANVAGGALLGGGGAALTGGNVLQGALLGGAGGYLQGAGGVGAETDASFLANDAAQLAKAGLSESQISQVLGAAGYASGPAANLAASMAVNGLDVTTMTNQLNNLSTNTGLMSQTGSSANFLAADALQLQGQVGNNFAAIEQNLIASGVDPLVAADVSQQLAFNPNLTQTELATNLSNSFGNNIYDVNVAQTYPTSTLPGAGGLLSNVAGAGTAVAGTPVSLGMTPEQLAAADALGSADVAGGLTAEQAAAAGLGGGIPAVTAGTGLLSSLTPSQIANLVKAGVSLTGIAGAASLAQPTQATTPLQAPTQAMPAYTPEYYQQLQQYYNAYLPQTPRDVVGPLQQWYNAKSGA